ncbi:predicted protein [Botrytis cinerea T4]|uniref:Uncharacterized protein n=1 Tax=Botryotinia fuckeliana (strain T4) TaxID=999810 RepID=G2YJH9_BOTF4|nr:predicted protein [Botrytis cinerea T4]
MSSKLLAKYRPIVYYILVRERHCWYYKPNLELVRRIGSPVRATIMSSGSFESISRFSLTAASNLAHNLKPGKFSSTNRAADK